MMKKMKRLAVMTACAALAGTVTAGAACLPQGMPQLKPGLNTIVIGSQGGSLPLDSIRQALDRLCNTMNKPQDCPVLPDGGIETPNIRPDMPGQVPVPDGGTELPGDGAETPNIKPGAPGQSPAPDGGTGTPDNGGNPGNGGTEAPDATPDAGEGTQSSYAAEVVRLVNAERQKAGLPSLTVNAGAQSAAQTRAGELQRSFSHTRPNGGSAFTALTEAGVNYRTAGENIAMGQKTPAEVVSSWMNSSGHRANILGSQFTSIGVGYVTGSNGTAYWTQLFIG